METCVMRFMARRWWRRVEVWTIAILLVLGGAAMGFQLGQWYLAAEHTRQLQEVRHAYDEAIKGRDLRMDKIAGKAERASDAAQQAASKASEAADTAKEAAEKAAQ